MTNHLFELAGNRKTETVIPKSKKKWYQGKPVVSAAILILIVLGCLCAELIMTKDPAYMDLLNYNKAPDREFLFGTDTMGRDIFSMIWYGGRISILIGGLATVISTFIAVVVGAFRNILKYTNSASDHFAAGYYGRCKYPESVLCDRCDQLDQYCESSTHRGTADTKQ